MKIIVIVAVILAGAIGGYYYWQITSIPDPNRDSGPQHVAYKGANKAQAARLLDKVIKSVSLSREKLGSVHFVLNGRPPYTFAYSDRARWESGSETFTLPTGGAFMFPGHHEGWTFIVRDVLPDKVVLEYHFSYSFNRDSSEDSGQVGLAYRPAVEAAGKK